MRKILNFSLTAIFLLAIGYRVYTLFGGGDEGQKAMDLYNRGNYSKARTLFQKLAAEGNSGAAYNLGVMYANGQGVSQNLVEARKWFILAGDARRPEPGDSEQVTDAGSRSTGQTIGQELETEKLGLV